MNTGDKYKGNMNKGEMKKSSIDYGYSRPAKGLMSDAPRLPQVYRHCIGLSLGLVFAVAALTLSAGTAVAAGATQDQMAPDAAAGQKIAGAVCAACHGGDGNSPLPVNPHLAGQHYAYLVKQLSEFKSVGGAPAKRANPVMAGFAAALSDADIKNVAAHYSSQKLRPAAATDKALAEVGQTLYRAGDKARGLPSCMGCHGPNGAGIPGQYPYLGGQHSEYTASQLTAFRQGIRANNTPMTSIATKLSDQEIKALSDYIAGLR